jgi:glutaredoxin
MLALFGALLAPATPAAGVYKWTDADGRTQFGDRPPEDVAAQEINIKAFDGSAEASSVGDAAIDRSVTLLSATWCGVCTRAKEHLRARGISFTEHDVEKSGIGKSEFKRLNGKGVPIILVGQQRMNGFSVAGLDKLLKDAGLLKRPGE